jgi:hypothetical protein
MRFVTAVVHSVENLPAASDFFCTALGFYLQNQSHYGILLENGSVTVRLVTQNSSIAKPLELEMYSKQLAEDTKALLAFPGISLISERVQINPYRLETRLRAPHNLIIALFQEFNEDELGILPPLPIALDWQQQAIDSIQQLLTYVPIDFRDLARSRVTEQAELLAAEQGKITVNLDFALQALAQTTPLFQHPTLVIALRERNIDPTLYFPTPS